MPHAREPMVDDIAASCSLDAIEDRPDEPSRMMPTKAELEAMSASVVYPHSLTSGVGNQEFGRFGMDMLAVFHKYRLRVEHYPKKHGSGHGEDVIKALESTFRVIDTRSTGNVVNDAIVTPYTKVITLPQQLSQTVFCFYLFVYVVFVPVAVVGRFLCFLCIC